MDWIFENTVLYTILNSINDSDNDEQEHMSENKKYKGENDIMRILSTQDKKKIINVNFISKIYLSFENGKHEIVVEQISETEDRIVVAEYNKEKSAKYAFSCILNELNTNNSIIFPKTESELEEYTEDDFKLLAHENDFAYILFNDQE